MRSVRLVLAGVALVLASCAGGAASSGSEVLRGLPPRTDPPFDLTDDEDLARARAAFDALRLDDATRGPRRRELATAYAARIRALADAPALAATRFRDALGLWDARELDDAKRAPPDLELLAGSADEIFKRSGGSGAEEEAVTALVVLRAAHPEKAAEYDKTWKDIQAYTNDLAVAEAGPGAERSRAIIALETATASFPSRWAGEQLVALYLARQEMVTKAVSSGSKSEILGVHRDPGVIRPVWNVVRAHARMRRVADARPVADKLAGQFGDEPELRKRLAAALEGNDGKAWVGLMAAYVPSEGREDGDAAAALAICEEGAARLPRSVEPRKCAAELARITDRAPLAGRWVKEALAFAPDDRDLAEIQARLYVAELADLLGTERLQAAARVVDDAERFYAGADKVFAGKPIETTLADLYLVYGRGLYTQGEVPRAVQALERSRALEKQPEVTEELAQIALKTGRYREAQRGFEEAAAAPRPTPIETTFDGNRLRRLAGDAAAAAGDRHRAEMLWTKALASWGESLGASLPARARAQAMSEIGRLYHALGQTEKAMQAFNQAVDLDPEQTGVYGDVIAFLATRGHYAEALDAYHRALGRAEVSEYLKAYTSFWMLDLARLRGAAVDPSTTEFLGSIAKGDKWYHLIARFKLGQMTWNELVARADTRGKRAEAYFYEGMARYVAGDRARAEKLMSEVLATQMLGFFEYDMASHYLRYGPPRAEVAKKAR